MLAVMKFLRQIFMVACCVTLAACCEAQTPTPVSVDAAVVASVSSQAPTAEPPKAAAPAQDPVSINMGLGAIVPTNRPYEPLTGAQRFTLWQRDNFMNPQRIGRNLVWSIVDVSRNSPPEWGTGMTGFGQRFGSRFARSMISSSIEGASAAAMGYEVRYVSCKSNGKMARLGHAFLYRVVTLDRHGKPVLNIPQLMGSYASEMIATQWTPGEKWSAQGVRSANEQLLFGVGMNILREFLPDLKRKLKRKK